MEKKVRRGRDLNPQSYAAMSAAIPFTVVGPYPPRSARYARASRLARTLRDDRAFFVFVTGSSEVSAW